MKKNKKANGMWRIQEPIKYAEQSAIDKLNDAITKPDAKVSLITIDDLFMLYRNLGISPMINDGKIIGFESSAGV